MEVIRQMLLHAPLGTLDPLLSVLEFGEKLRQVVQKQLGTVNGVDMDVEKLPQFQEEWQRTLVELDLQYTKLLDEYKQQLKTID